MTDPPAADSRVPRHTLAFGPFRFDPVNRILSRGDEELPLPPRALSVLSTLLEQPGAVISKQSLLDAVWNGINVSESSLSEAVRLLRQALEDDSQEPKYIQTVHRRGYRFIAVVTSQAGEVAPIPPEERQAEDVAIGSVTATGTLPVASPARSRARRMWLAASAAALLLALAVGAFLAGRRSAPLPRPAKVTRFSMPVPAGQRLEWITPNIAVSADGQHVVNVVHRGGETVLVHRDVSGFGSRELAGTRGAYAPFFSPDGRRVGFFANGQLQTVPLAGGPAVSLLRVVNFPFVGASWGPDDTIVFGAGAPASLYRFRLGGPVARLTRPDPSRGEFEHRWPHLLPGGEALLFTSWSTTLWDARVEWLSLVTGERRTVLAGASDAHYADGVLVCGRSDRSVVAAQFDPRSGQLTSPVLPLIPGVIVLEASGVTQLGIGGRTLVYLPGSNAEPARRLERVVDGKPAPLAAATRYYRNAQAGGKGQVVATALTQGRSDVWIVDAASGASSRLTYAGFNVDPIWSPDARWVAFASKTDGPFNIYRRRADGSGAPERLVASRYDQHPLAFSPDGCELMLLELNPATSWDLLLLDLETRKVRPWLRTKAREAAATWSPDGKWIAYSSDETGTWETHVRSFAGGTGRWHVPIDGAFSAGWAEDGRSMFLFRSNPRRRMGELWSVPTETAAADFRHGVPREVYAAPNMFYAEAGRGGVMIITEGARPPDPAEVRVVLDWRATLPAAITARR